MSTKHPPKPLIALVVLLIVAGLATWYWAANRDDGEAMALTGTVDARQYRVASAIPGTVTEVLVQEGASVKKGAVLVRLDSRSLALQVEQAQEGVNAAEAAVDQARDDAGNSTDSSVVAAKAALKQAQAAVSLAKVQQGNATITAPHDGTVVTVTTNAGQNAGPGATLMSLVDPRDVFVRSYVPEPRLGSVRIGKPADVTSGDKTHSGTVTFVAASPEFTPNAVDTPDQRVNLVYEVRVTVSDKSGALKPGLPVDVTFR